MPLFELLKSTVFSVGITMCFNGESRVEVYF